MQSAVGQQGVFKAYAFKVLMLLWYLTSAGHIALQLAGMSGNQTSNAHHGAIGPRIALLAVYSTQQDTE
jgi:hypothetical protein